MHPGWTEDKLLLTNRIIQYLMAEKYFSVTTSRHPASRALLCKHTPTIGLAIRGPEEELLAQSAAQKPGGLPWAGY